MDFRTAAGSVGSEAAREPTETRRTRTASAGPTVLDQVADTFYVKGPDGKKLVDPQAIEALRRDLLKVGGGNHGDG